MASTPALTRSVEKRAEHAPLCNSTARTRICALLVGTGLVSATLIAVVLTGSLRWRTARDAAWRCDELAMLQRFTGASGHVGNEVQATAFAPSLYTFRQGVLRGLRPPRSVAALHTTTNLWSNLGLHVVGVTPLGGRIFPLLFSGLALLTCAWAACSVTGRWSAGLAAAWFVSMSPHGTTYAAQARGYSEALALAPLLWLLWDAMRQAPQRTNRPVLLLLVSVQLSCTVYTSWVYWVLPVTLTALAFAHFGDRRASASARPLAWLVAGSVFTLMTLFTLDRWESLAFTSSAMGTRLHGTSELVAFVREVCVELAPVPVCAVALIAVGAAVAWRTPQRWWLWSLAASIATVVSVGIVNGSAGYARNLGFLVGPTAVLFGVGAGRSLDGVARSGRVVLAAAAGMVLLGGTALSYASLPQKVEAMLRPDWGSAVLALRNEPAAIGPSWMCRCLANHWQQEWYSAPQDVAQALALELGERMEVILGTQLDEAGRPVVFVEHGSVRGIVERPLPVHLRAFRPAMSRGGVELRRWSARRLPHEEIVGASGGVPVFALLTLPARGDGRRWSQFLAGILDSDSEIVTFRPAVYEKSVVHNLIVPAPRVAELAAHFERHFGTAETSLRLFELESGSE